MDILFDNHRLIHIQDWKYAYPILYPVEIDDLPNFEIETNVFHINAIEIAASCMEMILISSKNIANIISNRQDIFDPKERSSNKQKKNKKVKNGL